MPELIAVSYPDESLAGRSAAELHRCSAELGMDPDAIVIAVVDRDGTSHLETSWQPGSDAAWSRFWGGLFEAVAGDEEVSGLDADFRQRVRGALLPGTSLMLFVAASERSRDALEAVSQFDGGSFRSRLEHASPERQFGVAVPEKSR